MPRDAEVWRALLRAKGVSVAEVAKSLATTRQHAHRLLTGARSAEARREDLERTLALGSEDESGEGPVYAIAVLSHGEVALLPAGDTQPLFADRDLATSVANALSEQDPGVCVAPVWPEYAWRSLVAFHAAWGSEAEPRRVFIVDDPSSEGPVDALVAELTEGFADTLRLRGLADDPGRLREVGELLNRRR